MKGRVVAMATSYKNILKFFLFSFIGAFGFFVPVNINGKSTILIDHITDFLEDILGMIMPFIVLIVVIIAIIHMIYTKLWKKNTIHLILSGFKILGLIFTLMLIFNFGPSWILDPDVGPFIFEGLVISVILILPIGAIFLSLLIGYGLLEFLGVFLQPIMRPVFKTPGRSAVDAVASFVASYGLGLLLTNKVYLEGKYNLKEATIIVTGFSTASVSFMVVMANTLDIMHLWNRFFWITLIVTFLVTAITTRLWPLNRVKESYVTGEGFPEKVVTKNRFKEAWSQAMETVEAAPPLHKNLAENLKEGFVMLIQLTPLLIAIGITGMALAENTFIFDVAAYIFFPITWLLQIPDPLLAAKALSVGIAEVFLPTLLVADAGLITKFIVGSVSFVSIIFFSGTIPTILATKIPIKISDLIILYILRTILALIIITPIAFLVL